MKNKIEIYKTPENQTEIQVQFEEDTVWLSQKQMGQLFEKDTDTIGLHLKNIYESGKLQEVATTEESSVVQQEGKRQVRLKKAFEGKFLSEAEIEQYKQETDYEPASVLIKKTAK